MISHNNNKIFIIMTAFVLSYICCTPSAFALCTSDFSASGLSATSTGLITAIMASITTVLQNLGKALYIGIIDDPNKYYQTILNAVIVLVIVAYGIMITFDLANLRPGEVVSRIFKIGLILWLASPNGGWEFFSETFAKFFFGAMLELINIFLEGAAGMVNPNVSLTSPQGLGAPLSVLGYPISLIFSFKYMATILGLIAYGIYGKVFALLLIWAGFSLLSAICQAFFVYIKCIVGLWFLFALAPIFFIFLLFQRTSKLFEGWLNMIISFVLQPILLFSFLSFFIVMITSSLSNIFRVNWCWEPFIAHIFGIIPIPWMWFVPKMAGGKQISGTSGMFGDTNNPNIQFPIEAIDVLFFLMATYLMIQYGKMVPQLASQLSQGGLNVSGSMDDMRNFFQTRGWTPEQIGASVIGSTFRKLR